MEEHGKVKTEEPVGLVVEEEQLLLVKETLQEVRVPLIRDLREVQVMTTLFLMVVVVEEELHRLEKTQAITVLQMVEMD